MDNKEKFDIQEFEKSIIEIRSKEIISYSEEFENTLNEYIRLNLNGYVLSQWLYSDRKVLIARINRKIKERISYKTLPLDISNLAFDISNLAIEIYNEYHLNIDKQRGFGIVLQFPDNSTKEIQKLPRFPLKDEIITYDNVDYYIYRIKWDVTNGNAILKLHR